jgi:ribosomal protein S18 acetylase RimI-like enzyme
MDKWDKLILESIINVIKNEKKITYESGDPSEYQDQFSEMWLNHMNYLQSIETFPYKVEFNKGMFVESLNKFRHRHSEIRLFLAKEDKDMVAFLQAGITPNRKFGFISDLHVLESYRSRGIGENLIQNCFRWLKENRVTDCILEVAGGNEKVLEFYNKYGFKIQTYILKREI